jgi:hypothetical protein
MSNQNIQQRYVPLRTKEDVTEQQLNHLLTILHNLHPFLVPSNMLEDDNPALDGGAVSSAIATFAKVTDRIDAILDDPARWALKEVDELNGAILATQKAQQEFLAAQITSTREVLRPSFQLHPTLYVSDGKYLAVWGEPAIAGVGDTPSAALLDFDASFNRTSEEQLQLEVTEATPELPPESVPTTPLTVKPKRKKK